MMKIKSVLLVALMLVSVHVVAKNDKESQASDREVWTELCYKIAQPILENMSKGELRKRQTSGLYGSLWTPDGWYFTMACFAR